MVLTGRRRQILQLLTEAAREGASLSMRDVAERCGLRSPATVYQHFKALEREGLLVPSGRSRRYRVAAPPGIPIVGQIAPGEPIENPDGPRGALMLDPGAFNLRGDLLALDVVGDSLAAAGIRDGDFAIVRRQTRVEHGDIAVVRVRGASALKRVCAGRTRTPPDPEKAAFEPIRLGGKTDVQVYGKLIAVLRGPFKVV